VIISFRKYVDAGRLVKAIGQLFGFFFFLFEMIKMIKASVDVVDPKWFTLDPTFKNVPGSVPAPDSTPRKQAQVKQ
jgi:hypothetical protein